MLVDATNAQVGGNEVVLANDATDFAAIADEDRASRPHPCRGRRPVQGCSPTVKKSITLTPGVLVVAMVTVVFPSERNTPRPPATCSQ